MTISAPVHSGPTSTAHSVRPEKVKNASEVRTARTPTTGYAIRLGYALVHRKNMGNAHQAKLGASQTSTAHVVRTGHTHGSHTPSRRATTAVTVYNAASAAINATTTTNCPLTPW